MKSILCLQCGSNELYEDNGFIVCAYCQSRFTPEVDDRRRKETLIDVQADIDSLLKKCTEDPKNRRRYASLILDIDPCNLEAKQYLY